MSKRTVLLVDDEKEITLGLSLRLGAAGYTTKVESTAQAGLAAARETPDAIILDLHLGPDSGLDVVDTLRADIATANIPIVMLSASIAAEQQALDRGVTYFIRKPYRGEQILSAVETAIEQSNQGAQ